MWWLLACSAAVPPVDSGSGTPSETDADTDTDTDADSDADTDTDGDTDTDTDGLVGVAVDPPLAPPAFQVLDADGVERTEAWLPGHPTVLWFFREAEGTT